MIDVMNISKALVIPAPQQLTGVSTSAIASGDFVSDAQTVFEGFDKQAHVEIVGVRLWEAATAQKKDLRLWIFNTVIASTINSNDAAAISAAEALTLIGTIDIEDTDYINTASTEAAVVKILAVPIPAYLPTGNIYVFVTARESVTYTSATPLKITPIVRQHE